MAILIILTAGTVGLTARASGNPDYVEIGRTLCYLPLQGPASVALKVPANTASVTFIYERLSFDEGSHALTVRVVDGVATAIIPMEHTTQPGVEYHWEVTANGATVSTADAYIPFISESSEPLAMPLGQVAHDIEKANGSLPDSTVIASGQAQLPHILPKSSAPITSRNMEPRAIVDTEVHKGLDYGMTDGNNVYAMLGGVVHAIERGSPSSGWGNYVMIRHSGTSYYSHYAHLTSVVATLNVGDSVSKGTLLGTSGHTGGVDPHLDAAFDCYVGGVRLTLYPFRWFLASPSPYTSSEFDFIQTPVNGYSSTIGSYTRVVVSAAGSSGGATSVYIVYIPPGGSWTQAPMSIYSGTTYQFIWPTALKGKTVQYYVKAVRANVPSYWVTRPAKNAGSEPGIYYTIGVQ